MFTIAFPVLLTGMQSAFTQLVLTPLCRRASPDAVVIVYRPTTATCLYQSSITLQTPGNGAARIKSDAIPLHTVIGLPAIVLDGGVPVAVVGLVLAQAAALGVGLPGLLSLARRRTPAGQKPIAALDGRPTQPAFEPTPREWLRWQLGIAILGLAIFGFGLVAWFSPKLSSFYRSEGFWLAFVFPVFLPLAIRLLVHVRRSWRVNRVFEDNLQTDTATITHLWIDPPRPPGRLYYVGYRFATDYAAYQSVHHRTYHTLAIGDEIPVQYAGANPQLSRLNLSKRRRKKKTPPPPTGA